MNFISPIVESLKFEKRLIGGKGWALSKLADAGYPIPDGFVIMSSAFEYFCKDCNLKEEIQSLLSQINYNKLESINAISNDISNIIIRHSLPEILEKEILDSFYFQNLQQVAVRSSAAVEDGKVDSWAGMLDSFIDIRSDLLVENIKRCWASLYSPRALIYRNQKGIADTNNSVSVIIQKMVNSEKAGVAFSLHPTSYNKNQILIEAAHGTGEKVVSGSISPDSYLVDKTTLNIVTIDTRNHDTPIEGTAIASNIFNEKNIGYSPSVLSIIEIQSLAKVVRDIEAYFGYPSDIEWAFENNNIYILQARPITTIQSRKNASSILFDQCKAQLQEERLEYRQNWSGKWTIMECSMFGREYTKVLKEVYGVGLETSICTFDNGKSANYLVESELLNFSNILVAKAERNASIIYTWAEDIVEQADKVFYFVRKFKSQIISKDDFDDLWLILDGFLAANFPMKKIVDYLPQHLLKQALPVLEKARKYAEPVYDETFSFFQKFAIDNSFKLNLSPSQLLLMTQDEIENIYASASGPNIAELANRNSFSVISTLQGNTSILTGEAAANFAAQFLHKLNRSKILKGSCAYGGKVIGRIFVVNDVEKIRQLPPQSILVTGMTRPEYLPLFKEAIAVVTDAGGILSHAAIAARELGIPCVVGTEVATKVLQNGELVEVNADEGIIKILN